MENIELYYEENNEIINSLMEMKGYRRDVFIKINDKFYNVNVYCIERFMQDFHDGYECDGFYDIDPNIIIVKEVTTKDILKTLENLYKSDYFNKIKECDISKKNLEKVVL